MNALVAFRNVSCGEGAAAGLEEVGFTIGAGGITALCGPQGSGAVTALRLIARQEPPRRGTVLLQDRDIWLVPGAELAATIGILSHPGPELAGLTPRQVVETGLQPMGQGFTARADRLAAAHAALHLMGLPPSCGPVFGQQSEEQRWRILMARALALRPKLVLYRQTDPAPVALRLLSTLPARGITVIATLPDQDGAKGFADRVLVFDRGRIVRDATPEVSSSRAGAV